MQKKFTSVSPPIAQKHVEPIREMADMQQTDLRIGIKSFQSQSLLKENIDDSNINNYEEQDQITESLEIQPQKNQKLSKNDNLQKALFQLNNIISKKRDGATKKNIIKQQRQQQIISMLLRQQKTQVKNQSRQNSEKIEEIKSQKDLCDFCQNQFGNQNQALRFFCLHSFHQTCFQSIAPNSSFCPFCPNSLTGMSIEPQIQRKKQQILSQNDFINKNQNKQIHENKNLRFDKDVKEKQIHSTRKKQVLQNVGRKQSTQQWLLEVQNRTMQQQKRMKIFKIINCSFCDAELDYQNSIIFQCNHMFHQVCFQSIATNNSFCAFCPHVLRKSKTTQKKQIHFKNLDFQQMIYCQLCGQQIKIQNFNEHQYACNANKNQSCHYCSIQFPTDLINEHYKVCQLRQYFQNLSKVKQQLLAQRQKQKQTKIKMKQQKKLQMMKIMKRYAQKSSNAKRVKELFKQVVGYQCATGQGEEQCMICIQIFKKGQEISRLKCKHAFHCHCIIEWGCKKYSCPACRQELQMKQQIVQDDDFIDFI